MEGKQIVIYGLAAVGAIAAIRYFMNQKGKGAPVVNGDAGNNNFNVIKNRPSSRVATIGVGSTRFIVKKERGVKHLRRRCVDNSTVPSTVTSVRANTLCPSGTKQTGLYIGQ